MIPEIEDLLPPLVQEITDHHNDQHDGDERSQATIKVHTRSPPFDIDSVIQDDEELLCDLLNVRFQCAPGIRNKLQHVFVWIVIEHIRDAHFFFEIECYPSLAFFISDLFSSWYFQ